jgi:hypothetical protein
MVGSLQCKCGESTRVRMLSSVALVKVASLVVSLLWRVSIVRMQMLSWLPWRGRGSIATVEGVERPLIAAVVGPWQRGCGERGEGRGLSELSWRGRGGATPLRRECRGLQ